jgi:hypothetical protein
MRGGVAQLLVRSFGETFVAVVLAEVVAWGGAVLAGGGEAVVAGVGVVGETSEWIDGVWQVVPHLGEALRVVGAAIGECRAQVQQ